MICSMTCEIAVGTMLENPWKKPRNVPVIANIRIAGASTFSPYFAYSRFMICLVRTPENTYVISARIPPDMTAKRIAHRKTLFALRISPFWILSLISLETARGRLKEEIIRMME